MRGIILTLYIRKGAIFMEMIIKFNKMFLLGIESFLKPRKICNIKINNILSISDEDAFKFDWEITGNDIRKAIHYYDQEKK